MSRPITCDQCGRYAEPTAHGVPPAGWITLQVSGDPQGRDFCRSSCARNWLQYQIEPIEALRPAPSEWLRG